MSNHIFTNVEYESIYLKDYKVIAIYIDRNDVGLIYYEKCEDSETYYLYDRFINIKNIPELKTIPFERNDNNEALLISNRYINNIEYMSTIFKRNKGIIIHKYEDGSAFSINLTSSGNPFGLLKPEKYIETFTRSNFNILDSI